MKKVALAVMLLVVSAAAQAKKEIFVEKVDATRDARFATVLDRGNRHTLACSIARPDCHKLTLGKYYYVIFVDQKDHEAYWQHATFWLSSEEVDSRTGLPASPSIYYWVK